MVYTFYSFKGGVGRSMALANVAELLVMRGLRVLMVDMDLEAPGLERFFDGSDYLVAPNDVLRRRGMIDLIASYKDLRSLPTLGDSAADVAPGDPPFPVEPLREFVVALRDSPRGSLSLISAGQRNDEAYEAYADQVRSFDWQDFYQRWDGEAFFDWFRDEALTIADVVLVDSRTGITELSGVTTFHLADAVVMFVAPNRQNLDGCALVAESLRRPGLVAEGRRGRELKILAVPSRIDNSESELLDEFAVEFATRLAPSVSRGLHFDNSLFIDLKVPYVPAYSFRESVAVREADRAVASEMIRAYQRLTATLIELAPQKSRVTRLFHGGPEPARDDIPSPADDFVPRGWARAAVGRWLVDSDDPVLLVVGEPGAGKTAFMRWLAVLAADPSQDTETGRLPAPLLYAHHCEPYHEGSLDARVFVESLARRLGDNIRGYARAIRAERPSMVSVEVKENISATGESAAFVTDVGTERVSPMTAFEELVRRPLHRAGITDDLLVLVDGLDAAAEESSRESLVDLVAHLASGRLQTPLRLVVSCRPDARVLNSVRAPQLDLVHDEPEYAGDVGRYLRDQLDSAGLTEGPLTDEVIARADGNFAVARALISEVRSGDHAVPPLPPVLAGFYRDEITRLFGLEAGAREVDQRVLAPLAVAYEPLSPSQLCGITGLSLSEVGEVLARWTQFLYRDGEARFRLFHPSFREFLRTSSGYGIYADEAHLQVARFLLDHAKGGWMSVESDYGLRYAMRHLFAALATTDARGTREQAAKTIANLLADPDYLLAKAARLDPNSITRDLADGAHLLVPLSRVPEVQDLGRDVITLLESRQQDIASDSVEQSLTVDSLIGTLGTSVAGVYAEAYQEIRMSPASEDRTIRMNVLMNEIRQIAEYGLAGRADIARMLAGHDGERIVALALLKVQPDPAHFESIADAITASHSAFEQYHALDVLNRLLPLLSDSQRRRLIGVLDHERHDPRRLGVMSDTSRATRMLALLSRLLEDEATATESPE